MVPDLSTAGARSGLSADLTVTGTKAANLAPEPLLALSGVASGALSLPLGTGMNPAAAAKGTPLAGASLGGDSACLDRRALDSFFDDSWDAPAGRSGDDSPLVLTSTSRLSASGSASGDWLLRLVDGQGLGDGPSAPDQCQDDQADPPTQQQVLDAALEDWMDS
jgi:hypothetical protein